MCAVLRRTPVFRRLVAITHTQLNAGAYTRVADLAEDVKRTAARQRIPYDATTVSAALAAVGFRRRLTVERSSQNRNSDRQSIRG